MEKGKKLALVVGCNYPNTFYELHGCHNDALAMHEVLVARFGFSPENVELLMDKPGSPIMPTGANIMRALNKMVDKAEKGDILFFHYSGHGTLVKNQRFKREEAIVPSDFNLITSVDFRQLVNRVPVGATFTILSDSCHSGGLIDKEKEQIGPYTAPKDAPLNTPSGPYRPKAIPLELILEYFTSLTSKIRADIGEHLVEVFGQDVSLMFRAGPIDRPLRDDEGILLSGCQTDETSADVEFTGNACGAFSNAVQTVLRENPKRELSYREIVVMARKVLSLQHFQNQHPCLYCSDPNANAIFLGGSKATS